MHTKDPPRPVASSKDSLTLEIVNGALVLVMRAGSWMRCSERKFKSSLNLSDESEKGPDRSCSYHRPYSTLMYMHLYN